MGKSPSISISIKLWRLVHILPPVLCSANFSVFESPVPYSSRTIMSLPSPSPRTTMFPPVSLTLGHHVPSRLRHLGPLCSLPPPSPRTIIFPPVPLTLDHHVPSRLPHLGPSCSLPSPSPWTYMFPPVYLTFDPHDPSRLPYPGPSCSLPLPHLGPICSLPSPSPWLPRSTPSPRFLAWRHPPTHTPADLGQEASDMLLGIRRHVTCYQGSGGM